MQGRSEAEAAHKEPAPRLSPEPASYDVGKVREGEKVRRTFELHSVGASLLTIEDVKPRCGSCIEITLKRQRIPPGDSEDLVVEYELTDRVGKFVRYIVVESNDPKNSSVSLRLEGEIMPEFSINPKRLALGEILSGSIVSARLTLKRNFGGDLVVKSGEEVPRGLSVDLPGATTAAEGEEVVIPLTFEASPSPGSYKGTLILRVNGELHEELSIPVTADVVSPIRLAEEDVFFGIVPIAETKTRTIRLILADCVDAERLRVECDSELVRAELQLEGAEGGPNIRFSLLPIGEAGPFSVTVLVKGAVDQSEGSFEAICYGIRSR